MFAKKFPVYSVYMHTLYHHPLNPGSRYVRLLTGEYGQEMVLLEELIWQRRPEFLRLNPAGAIPVLQLENDACLCGATIIGEYLDETDGPMLRERRLMPENAVARAETRRLIEWFLVKFDQEVSRYMLQERVYKQLMRTGEGGGPPDTSIIRAARANLKGHLKYLSVLTQSRNWLAGDRLSGADIAAAASLSALDYLGEINWQEHAGIKDWYARLKCRPSFRVLLGDKLIGLPPVAHYTDLDF